MGAGGCGRIYNLTRATNGDDLFAQRGHEQARRKGIRLEQTLRERERERERNGNSVGPNNGFTMIIQPKQLPLIRDMDGDDD